MADEPKGDSLKSAVVTEADRLYEARYAEGYAAGRRAGLEAAIEACEAEVVGCDDAQAEAVYECSAAIRALLEKEGG